jgi:hypothetical protein
MSLKSFHVFFIVLAVLSSLGFALWAFTRGGAELASGLGATGVFSALMGVALAVYGVWFVVYKSGRLIV